MKTIPLNLSKFLRIVSYRYSMIIAGQILNWYKKHQRPLPWRTLKNPYYIWVSEIIMQQTRMNQGTPYYFRFIEQFPTVESLAKAPESAVLHLWQGLGYYSRARNMHQAAKQIVSQYHGQFPNSAKELKKLKGIGEYTSAAIASFCFNEPVPAIDGNVYRVITRFYDIDLPIDKAEGKKRVSTALEAEIDTEHAADFNQAMMDFGAMVCTPKNPNCQHCPIISNCLAYQNNTILSRPVKSKKAQQKKRYFYYFVPVFKGNTFVNQRKAKDIWHGLYEFPLHESQSLLSDTNLLNLPLFKNFTGTKKAASVHITRGKPHVLSHQLIYNTFVKIELHSRPNCKDYEVIPLKKLPTLAFPVLVLNYIKHELKR